MGFSSGAGPDRSSRDAVAASDKRLPIALVSSSAAGFGGLRNFPAQKLWDDRRNAAAAGGGRGVSNGPPHSAYTSKSDRGNTLNWPFASLAICVSTELSSSFQSDTVWIWSPLFPATASLATS